MKPGGQAKRQSPKTGGEQELANKWVGEGGEGGSTPGRQEHDQKFKVEVHHVLGPKTNEG